MVLLTQEWLGLPLRDQVPVLWHELIHVEQAEHADLRTAEARDIGGSTLLWYERDAEGRSWGLMADWERAVQRGDLPPLW